MDEWPGFGSSTPFADAGSLWEAPAAPSTSLWDAADLSVSGAGSSSAWPADPARPPSSLAAAFCPPVSSPWSPGAAAASGWPQGFPSDDADRK